MKKKKLNSNNPRYHRKDENTPKVRKELACEVKGVKVYKLYHL